MDYYLTNKIIIYIRNKSNNYMNKNLQFSHFLLYKKLYKY